MNGLLTGMTGVFIIPSVLYFQAIGLKREELIQAMGLLFGISSVSLFLAYQYQNLLTGQLVMLSSYAVIPSLIGMQLGKRLRQRLSEERFKRLMFIALLIMGCLVIIKAMLIS